MSNHAGVVITDIVTNGAAGVTVAAMVTAMAAGTTGVAAGIEHSQGAYRSAESGDARRVTNADFCADF
jgi:hypothetical protein